MKFWDSSALIPLMVDEPASRELRDLLKQDDEIVVWWGAPVECASAVARRRRDGHLTVARESAAHTVLGVLENHWTEVLASSNLRALARRLVRVHPIRAGDALQVAAAITWTDGQPAGQQLVSLDARLQDVARQEGFVVVPEA